MRKAGVLLCAISPLAATVLGRDFATEFMAVVFGEACGPYIFPAQGSLAAEEELEKLENWPNRPVGKTTGRCFWAERHRPFTGAFPDPFCLIVTVCRAVF